MITDIKGNFTLSNGVGMPYLGLGVWKAADGNEVEQAVKSALEMGYRHIDTAAIYKNEQGVGNAVKASGVAREEIFITTKVWNTDQGYDSTIKALDNSLQLLGMDYVDLYLVHWPVKNKFTETWRALEILYKEGKVKAIGVSNFLQHHLEEVLAAATIKPMVNQIEHHPRLVQPTLIDFCKKEGIQPEAWSPLMQGQIFEIEEMKTLAAKYNKSVAQLTIRWDLQNGVVVIPKSVNAKRIAENADVFDFEISAEDMNIITALDQGHRVGPHPDKIEF